MYFPKNLLSIKGAQAFRDFCLNPKGIKVFFSHTSLKFSNLLIKKDRTDFKLRKREKN